MVNYGNGLIYRLVCKDPSITDEYIGSTTNKNRRKQEHKLNCNNENYKNHNRKVYQFIRENGGFDNWDLILVEEYSCENRLQLLSRERFWIEERNPTLNCDIPIRTEEEKKNYEKSDKIKEYRKQYRQTDQFKEYHKEYEKTDKIKEYRKQYKQTDKYKESCKRYKLQQKIKNKSAIIIQKFFKKYLR